MAPVKKLFQDVADRRPDSPVDPRLFDHPGVSRVFLEAEGLRVSVQPLAHVGRVGTADGLAVLGGRDVLGAEEEEKPQDERGRQGGQESLETRHQEDDTPDAGDCQTRPWPFSGRRGFLKDFPTKFKRKTGGPYDALLSLVPANFGGRRCVQAIIMDVSEIRRAEEALRESEEKYRDLVENVNEVIYSVGLDGRILYLSPVVESILGYRPDELLGRPFTTVVHSPG
jgi:PAS domain-containing protein